MQLLKSEKLYYSERIKSFLEKQINKRNNPQWLITRVSIIFLSISGVSNRKISKELKIERNTVIKWRKRWKANESKFIELEKENYKEEALEKLIIDILKDAERSGCPSKFTSEQIIQIVKLACTPPQDLGIPITEWSTTELAKASIKEGFVENISSGSIWRFLNEADLKPHQIRYWLNSDIANEEKKKNL